MDDNTEFAAFARDVDRALKRLYDPAALRSSPLIGMLEMPAKAGPADLRQALLNAIEALRPQGAMAEQGKAWRTYQVLFHRFVGQFSQVDVAHTLNLSIRQMAREESRAAQALADYLWSRHAVAQRVATEPLDQEKNPPSQDEEIKWLQQSLPTEAISIEETIQTALATLAPLLKAVGVTAETVIARPVARVAGQSGVLRQAVLNALSVACRTVPGGTVHISVDAAGRQVSICIQPVAGAAPAASSPETPDSFAMISRLLGLLDGQLAVTSGADARQPFTIRMTLPAAQQLPILVIDDNADTLHLYERYLANSRYLFCGRSDPLQTLELARSLQPQIIVLDVMLPGMDGWELMQRLRAEPATSAIPIVVCSILPEQPLAEAMGAAAYLRKPVSREDFLATVHRLAGSPAPGSPA
jgi:CheY-like chemotaxis protein